MSESRPAGNPIGMHRLNPDTPSDAACAPLPNSSMIKRVYIDTDMDSPELFSVCDGTVAVLCRRSPEKETANEDSAAVIELAADTAVFIVADGVGGGPAGDKASSAAIEAVCQSVITADPNQSLRSRILDGIELASESILELGLGAATTLTVVEINGGIARGYQVGDSMAMIYGQRGALKWKSMPHSPVGYAIEAGLLDETEAMEHEDRHLVSNLVGCRDMHIDIGPRQQLSSRDTILLASDGLYDNLYPQEVIDLSKNGRPEDRINALAKLSADRMSNPEADNPGKPDDLTVLLYARRSRSEAAPDSPRDVS